MRSPTSAVALTISPRGRPPTAGLRGNILRAAERVFAQHDYHEVLMDDVARACGVAKGTLYRYFPGKRELYLAMMFEGIERLRDELRIAVGVAEQPARKVERAVRCILGYFWDRRFFFALINRNEHKPDDPDFREWLRRRTELSRLIQGALEEAMSAGHVRRVDPRIATEMLMGMLRGANRYRTAHDTLDTMVAAVLDVFLFGVGTAAGRRLAGTPVRRRLVLNGRGRRK
jgi:AcrR family transcriptional regulator